MPTCPTTNNCWNFLEVVRSRNLLDFIKIGSICDYPLEAHNWKTILAHSETQLIQFMFLGSWLLVMGLRQPGCGEPFRWWTMQEMTTAFANQMLFPNACLAVFELQFLPVRFVTGDNLLLVLQYESCWRDWRTSSAMMVGRSCASVWKPLLRQVAPFFMLTQNMIGDATPPSDFLEHFELSLGQKLQKGLLIITYFLHRPSATIVDQPWSLMITSEH